MNALRQFLDMGGYGVYIWLAYGMLLFSLFTAFFLLRRAKKRLLARKPPC